MNKPVLLIPGHPNSSDLWPGLSEHYTLCYLYPQAAQYAQSLGIQDALSVAQFLDADAHEHALNETAFLTAQLIGQMENISARLESIVGVNSPPALNGQFSNWFGGFMLHQLRERLAELAALDAMRAKLVEQSIAIAGCVTHEDVSIDTRAMVLWCKENEIPTIHVPHANCHLCADAGPDIHRESLCDWLCAAGPYMKRWYISNGYPEDRIVITGAPYWDGLYENDLPDRQEARAALGLNESDLVFAYATTWTQTTGLRGGWEIETNAGLKAVMELAKSKDAKLIIKVHPHDAQKSEEAYAQVLHAANIGGLVTRLHGNYTLRASDVLIAQGPSNLCVEAAIVGTPSVYLRTEGFEYEHALPYRADGDDLPIAVEAALNSRDDPYWENFVAQYNDAHPRGGASARVVEVVKEKCLLSVFEPMAP